MTSAGNTLTAGFKFSNCFFTLAPKFTTEKAQTRDQYQFQSNPLSDTTCTEYLSAALKTFLTTCRALR